MNKIRYWKKQLNLIEGLLDCDFDFKRDSELYKRIYDLSGTIGNYIEDLTGKLYTRFK